MPPLSEDELKLAVAATQDHGPPREEEPAAGADWSAHLIGRVVAKHRIVRRLGQGGMGVVFEAVHESIGGRAAVKVLSPVLSADPRLVQRFLNEARAVSIVRHAGLVKIFDFGQFDGGMLYLLMEFLEGEPLRERLERGRVSPAEAVRLGRQIASALAAAHDHGIAHRDLKPDNVFIVPDEEAPGGERAKVLDFGLAKVVAPAPPGEDPARHTASGTIMGTPAYMAPEQCRSLGQADSQSDVYALGVMLYEMLAGRLPFSAPAPGDLIAMHLLTEPPPLQEAAPGTPADLVALVHKMLAKDPKERPTMLEVVTQLGPAQAATTVPIAPLADRRAPALALALLCLGLGGAGLWLARSGGGAQPDLDLAAPVRPAVEPVRAKEPAPDLGLAPPPPPPPVNRKPVRRPPRERRAPSEAAPPAPAPEPREEPDVVVPAVR